MVQECVVWCIDKTGKPPSVLLREGWTWAEVVMVAGLQRQVRQAEADAADRGRGR